MHSLPPFLNSLIPIAVSPPFTPQYLPFPPLPPELPLCFSSEKSRLPRDVCEGHWLPAAGVTGGHDPLDAGTRNQTQVLCKSNKHS